VQIETDPRGCLVVSVPGITASPVVTNDLVEIIEERSFRWLGRIDNRISSGGIKIIPELIEARLREKLPYEVVILGIPDKKLGQKLVLVVEAENREELPSDFSEWMKKHLQKHEIPKEIRFLRTFPRNASRKIDRLQIKLPAS
jgi:O-succinylbenzoic acid--CoA ligase